METKTHNPSFTVSLRGYDREEVDDYLDSLAEALEQVDSAEEHTRQLQSHINRLNARIKELEDRLKTESPRSGLAVGERIGVLLRHAEETAEETVTRAEAQAAQIVNAAEERVEEADQIVRSATARAEEQGRRIEAAARAEASDIVAEAEGRAAARTRQIEQWAEQVISHTRAEEARMLLEQKQARDSFNAELGALAAQRAAAQKTLLELRDAVGRAVGIIDTRDEQAPSADAATAEHATLEADEEGETEDATATADAPPTAAAAAAADEVDLVEAHDTGAVSAIPAGSDEDDEQYEEKIEAWVNWSNGASAAD